MSRTHPPLSSCPTKFDPTSTINNFPSYCLTALPVHTINAPTHRPRLRQNCITEVTTRNPKQSGEENRTAVRQVDDSAASSNSNSNSNALFQVESRMARAIDSPPRSQTKHRKSTSQLQYEAQKTRTRSTPKKFRLQHHSEELPRDAKRRKHANDPTFKLSLKTQTRITTRYSIKPVASRRTSRDAAGDAETAGPSKPPRGSLVITTYDPVSGVNLKYRTTKAAEVTRLMHSALGRLGRCMAGLPAEAPEEAMPDAPVPVSAVEGADGDKQGSGGVATPVQQGQQAQPGGGKKKKKGRK